MVTSGLNPETIDKYRQVSMSKPSELQTISLFSRNVHHLSRALVELIVFENAMTIVNIVD